MPTAIMAEAGEGALTHAADAAESAETRCSTMLRLLRQGGPAAFADARQLLPLLRPDPACDRVFQQLEWASRQHPVQPEARLLLAQLISHGLTPPRDGLGPVAAALPEGPAGDIAFDHLLRQDFARPVRGWWGLPYNEFQVSGSPLRQFAMSNLTASDVPVPQARWGALLARQPAEAICAALPDAVTLGWHRLGRSDTTSQTALRPILDHATAVLVARCAPDRLGAFGRDPNARFMWAGLLAARAFPLVRQMLRAGIRPEDAVALAGQLACTGDPLAAAAALDGGLADAADLLPPFFAWLRAAEAPRPGEVATLGLLLTRGAPSTTPVDEDAPAAIAAALGRNDILALLRRHGAPVVALPPERAHLWRHRRIAALLGYPAPQLDFEPAQQDALHASLNAARIGPGRHGWLVTGQCGNVNCGHAIVVEERGRFRVLLEDGGHSVDLLRTAHGGLYDVLIIARGSAATHHTTLWRFDGRVYRRATCNTLTHTGDGPAERSRVRCAR